MSTEYTQDRFEELKENIESVQVEVDEAAGSSSRSSGSGKPRLVAVSKLKPASDIQALYDAGYRHFGENYIQEMVDKAELLPKDINWHFIGSLQSNKAKIAAAIPNLFLLETLSSIKTADLLNKGRQPTQTPLNVYIQINTSSEDSKSGIPCSNPSEVLELAKHILTKCESLKLLGLMTIGSFEASHDPSKPNPDFESLKATRKQLVEALGGEGIDGAPNSEEDLELSMGMSTDFVEAVKSGSGSVRVGTRIFGQRPPRK